MKATQSSMGHDSGPKSTEACTYPVEVLPGPVAALVQAIVDVHGVPAAMSATIALSMLSASIGKGLLILGAKGRRTMGNLFVLISAPTGVGKSTVINILREPIDMILDYLQACADSHCTLPPPPPQMPEGEEESHGDLDVLPPPAGDVAPPQHARGGPPRLVCSDATGPALAKILLQNNETILVATPEAGNHLDEASKPASLFGQLLLKGYSGDKAEFDRATKQPVILNQPCITVCWLCQPHRVSKFFGSERLMEDGLIARFLFVETKVGMPYMPEEDRTIPVSIINGYSAIVSELYDAYRGRGGHAEIVRLSDGVYEIMRDYHNDCVRQLQEVDNNLSFCIPRWPEQAWKIMLVLHAAEHGSKSHLLPVDRQTAERAITLMRWYADRLDAEAELEDSLAGVEPSMADHADVEQIVPILGRIVCSGGVIKSVQHEWIAAHDKEAERRGIMLVWRWIRSLHSPDAGTCTGFHAGTREAGPLVNWSADDGYWRRCRSTGNFGKNWAFGGNWEREVIKPNEDPPAGAISHRGEYVYESFEACNPVLYHAVQDILKSQIRPDDARVARARAKLEAAKLRQIAASHRCRAEGHRRQASSAVDAQNHDYHCKNAEIQDALTKKHEARAVLAESGK